MAKVMLTDGSGRWFNDSLTQDFDMDEGRIVRERLSKTGGGTYILNKWCDDFDNYEVLTLRQVKQWFEDNGYEEQALSIDTIEDLMEIK